jgi:hypothetical protein
MPDRPSAPDKNRLTVECPCCQARLVVDSKTGLVIQSQSRKQDYSFEEALQREQARKAKSDDLFAEAFAKEKQRQSTLEEKFEEALRSKDELDAPPPRPWDLD